MADKTTTPLYIRKFLNKPRQQAGAYVIAQVDREESLWTSGSGDERHSLYFTYTLRISDCDRVISLDFNDAPENFGNNLYKVDSLLDALSKFRAAMVLAQDEKAAFLEKHGDG